MRYYVDENCIGCGLCEGMCPEEMCIRDSYCGVTRMHLWRFNLHKTNAVNEELVISLFDGREVQERGQYPIATYILTA